MNNLSFLAELGVIFKGEVWGETETVAESIVTLEKTVIDRTALIGLVKNPDFTGIEYLPDVGIIKFNFKR